VLIKVLVVLFLFHNDALSLGVIKSCLSLFILGMQLVDLQKLDPVPLPKNIELR
jgi:hypothetical protein